MERQSRDSDHWRWLCWCESGLSPGQSRDEGRGPPGEIGAHCWVYLARSKESTSQLSCSLSCALGPWVSFPFTAPRCCLFRVSSLPTVFHGWHTSRWWSTLRLSLSGTCGWLLDSHPSAAIFYPVTCGK